jgi:site-specific DNA recombinase
VEPTPTSSVSAANVTRTNCKQRAVNVDRAEQAVAAHYKTIQLPTRDVQRLRTYLGDQLSKLGTDAARERGIHERRLQKLDRERKKLLDAHYADAIPLDLLKSEQARIATEAAAIEGRLVAVAGDFEAAEVNLQRALTRVEDCAEAYRAAPEKLRRQFNLAFFKRLLITDEYEVDGDLAEPCGMLLSEELRRAAVAQGAEVLREDVEEALGRRSHEGATADEPTSRALVGAPSTAGPPMGDGFSQKILVRMRGLEPPRSHLHTDLNRARLPIPPHPQVTDRDSIATALTCLATLRVHVEAHRLRPWSLC